MTKLEQKWFVRTTNGDWREYPCYQRYCDMEQLHVQIVGCLNSTDDASHLGTVDSTTASINP